MFEDEPALAWRVTPYRAQVFAADFLEIGTAESLLADDGADIFHGLAVQRRLDGKLVEIPAARITKITAKGILTDLADDDVKALVPYSEERWYHIGWGGLFRNGPGWEKTTRT
jgi:hypothetical protein